MKKQRLTALSIVSIGWALLWSSPICLAATGEELVAAFEQMQSPTLSSERVLTISDYTIEHHDFSLKLESGRLYLYDPIMIDSRPQEWGGLFVGQAVFSFKPAITMEIDQLRKFYSQASLAEPVGEIELLFGQAILDRLLDGARFESSQITGRLEKSIEEQHQFLVGRKQIAPLFGALKGIVFPGSRPFLLANAALGKLGQTIYTFDPYDREEVSLKLHYWGLVGGGFMELVSSYSQYATGSLATISGLDKDQLSLTHYDLKTSLDKRGEALCEARLFAVVTKPVQMIRLQLNHQLEVTTVIRNEQDSVQFKRWSEKKYKRSGLWLFFDRLLEPGDTLNIMVRSEGELARRTLVGFAVVAGGTWYPRYSSQRATFDMSFKTPETLAFVASGKLLNQKTRDDTLHTSWSLVDPALHVSFSMGLHQKYELLEDNAPPIEVYFDPGLHVKLQYDRNEEKTVADDLANSLKLFAHHFGPYQYAKLVATELLGFHGQAFPGMVHLGFTTFAETDRRGTDRLFRAHEVAHQWWGGGTDNLTYHDAWLSEGFAEYSALMYVQATAGNDRMMNLLKDYRRQIFSARKFLLSSGEESGSILLGGRASSTKTGGDYSLVIYKKGAFVLHMLRNLLLDLNSMSDERFLTMMREWYRTNKGREATTYEFKRLVDKHVGEDMSWFFDQFVVGTDLPTYRFSYESEKMPDGRTAVMCHIEQEGVPEGFKMYVPVEIEFGSGEKLYMRLLVDRPSLELELPLVEGVVKAVRLNPFHSVLCQIKD